MINLIVTGFMGTDKTQVRRRKAKPQGWPLVDVVQKTQELS